MALASGVNVLSGSGSVAMVPSGDVETNAGGSYDVAWTLATTPAGRLPSTRPRRKFARRLTRQEAMPESPHATPAGDGRRGVGEDTSMRISIHPVLVGAMVLLGLVAGAGPATAQDKDTLVIALDTLGAMVMDPIADTRAPHAH